MITVALRNAEATVPILTIGDLDVDAVVDSVAGLAGRQIRPDQVDAFTQVLAARFDAPTMLASDVGDQTFTVMSVVDGDVSFDFSLGQFRDLQSEPRDWHGRWTSGGGSSTPYQGGTYGPGSGPYKKMFDDEGVPLAELNQISGEQAAAERDKVAKQIADAHTEDQRIAVLSELRSKGNAATAAEFDRRADGTYSTARTAEQDQMISDMLAQAGNVGHDHQVVILGGLPGSGKGGVDFAKLGLDPSHYLRLDPDTVKQAMLDRGMVKRVKGMTDGEHAALLHEESSYITGELRKRAIRSGMNVIIDKTLSSSPAKDMALMKAAGYKARGIFVDIKVAESVESTLGRWRRKGRFVPPSYIHKSDPPTGSKAWSTNRANFDAVRADFDEWAWIDNTGIAKGKPIGTIHRGRGDHEFAPGSFTVHTNRAEFRDVTAEARDYHGRWSPGSAAAPVDPGWAADKGDTVVVGDRVRVKAEAAARLVENLGTRPSPSDLTKVTVTGHPNLFSAVAHGTLRRVDMPQVPGDKLDEFKSYLADRGIRTRHERVDPVTLAATQNELDGRKTGQMVTAMRTGTMAVADKPMWISADNRVLDGHHRWAAAALLTLEDPGNPHKLSVVRVMTPMATLLGMARQFNQAHSIDSKAHGMAAATAEFRDHGHTDKGNTAKRGYDSKYEAKRVELLRDHPKCHWCRTATATEADHYRNGLVPSCSDCNNRRSHEQQNAAAGVATVEFGFNPGEARDDHGRWTTGGGSTGGTLPGNWPKLTGDLSKPDGGFTLSVPDLAPISTGYAVAIEGTDRLLLASSAFSADGKPNAALKRFLVDRVDAAVAAAAPPGTKMAVGGWHNPGDGKLEVNVTAVFPNGPGQREKAIAFGATHNQISILHLDTFEFIDTGGTGGDRLPDNLVAGGANQPRVPAGNTDGGRWTSYGPGHPTMEDLPGIAGHWITEAVESGRPITVTSAIEDASESTLDKYLTQCVAPESFKGLNVAAKRALATKVNTQHIADVAELVKLGYDAEPAEHFGAGLARQSVLRETGALTPLGGKNKGNAHVFYGEDAIDAMSIPEVEAFIAHHENTAKFVDYHGEEIGGAGTERYDALYKQAHLLDRSYQENVGQLTDKYGYTPDQITHSDGSTMKMLQGLSHGFATAAPPLQPPHQGKNSAIITEVNRLFDEYFKNPKAHPGWRGGTSLRPFGQ